MRQCRPVVQARRLGGAHFSPVDARRRPTPDPVAEEQLMSSLILHRRKRDDPAGYHEQGLGRRRRPDDIYPSQNVTEASAEFSAWMHAETNLVGNHERR